MGKTMEWIEAEMLHLESWIKDREGKVGEVERQLRELRDEIKDYEGTLKELRGDKDKLGG